MKIKVGELKNIFSKNSLTKLNRLKFIFTDEDLVPNLSEFDLDDDIALESPQEETFAPQEETFAPQEETFAPQEETFAPQEETFAPQEELPTQSNLDNHYQYLDENGNPIPLTDEEMEILEEEKRAERNRKILADKSGSKKPKTTIVKKVRNIELPPKKEMALVGNCNCGPNEACSTCMDDKDY